MGANRLKVAVTGSTGFLGSALSKELEQRGHQVLPISRSASSALDWSVEGGFASADALHQLDAVIHLAGEPVTGRWNDDKKRRMKDSRVLSTRRMAEQLADCASPKRFVVASAVGYYGDRGDEILTEDAPPGQGFLAELAVAWEAAAEPAKQAGHRVVHLRTGIVLSPQGGALAQMLPIFRLGLGGKLGSGHQYMPWISLRDWVRMTAEALENEVWMGPYNLTAPNPVRNSEFTRALAQSLGRPAFLSVPAFALKMLYGEFAEEGLLASQRVVPKKALDQGFTFEDEEISETLRRMRKT